MKTKTTKFTGPFLRVPHSVVAECQSDDEATREKARIHLVLMANCYHSEGIRTLKGKKYPCRKGEYYGTCKRLAAKCGIKEKKAARLINLLEQEGMLEKKRVGGGSCIYLKAYVKYLDQLDSLSRKDTDEYDNGLDIESIEP